MYIAHAWGKCKRIGYCFNRCIISICIHNILKKQPHAWVNQLHNGSWFRNGSLSFFYYLTSKHLQKPRRDNVTTWKRFIHYWLFVGGIQRSPVDSLHKQPLMWRFDVRLNKMLSMVWMPYLWCHDAHVASLWRTHNIWYSHVHIAFKFLPGRLSNFNVTTIC